MSFELSTTFASLPKTERGRPIVVHGDPKNKNFLYCNEDDVIIRDIADPTKADIYDKQPKPTVAKYSPSGFYIASGDAKGKVRIWDTVNKEHLLKYEYAVLGGLIKDICWTEDSKRICVVGEGREKYGHVFIWDTGASAGSIPGQTKWINNCDIRQQRPYRIVTASEDYSVAVFEGPPFRSMRQFNKHNNFATCVRYSPDGTTFTSAGGDQKAFVYDGKTGDYLRELGSPAHNGGIYAISYSPDSKKILTVSADKRAKIFDIETGAMDQEFVMGTGVEDMQVGCLWQGEHLLTVSLSGHINYLDRDCTANPTKPLRVIKGHNKAIVTMATNEDKSVVYTADFSGKICCWDVSTGLAEDMHGIPHSNQVQSMKVVGSLLYSVSMDDTCMISDIDTHQYGEKVGLPSQPKQLDATASGLCVIGCANNIIVLRHGKIVTNMTTHIEPDTVSIHPGGVLVAVGSSTEEEVHIYDLNECGTLDEQRRLTFSGRMTDLAFSPDGAYLAASNAKKNVKIWKIPTYDEVDSWGAHVTKVNSIDWSPDSSHLASTGVDGCLIVYDPSGMRAFQKLPGAHGLSDPTCVLWLGNNTIATGGRDCNVKIWTVTHT